MTKRETNENRRRLLREMVAEYDIRTIAELEKTLKEMFAGTISNGLKSELDAHLGYEKSSQEPKATTKQSRTLESIYPFVFLDALMVSVKSEGRAVKKAVYCAIGISTEGRKDILGIWINETEGTHFWLTIFEKLKARGIKKIHFISIDGLSGLEEAIMSCFPMAVVQRCIVHPIRNSVKYIPTKHYKDFCKDLKAVYAAVSLDAAVGLWSR